MAGPTIMKSGFVYRGGTRTNRSLTPRLHKDVSNVPGKAGLSAFERFDDANSEESGEVYLEPVTRPIALGPSETDWLTQVRREAQSLADRALPVLERLFECAKALRTPA